ncbi:MAG: hypothetical protein WDZ49_14305 [Litorilinea sp.]
MVALFVLAYGLAAGYNLGLPGLHYDEAKEAGLNALELLQGDPVTAFRGATLDLGIWSGTWSLPLMVQDYIGALNIYLVMPFLALSGVGVPNLRWPAVLIGVLTLLTLERLVSEWWTWHAPATGETPNTPAVHIHTPVTWAGLLSVALLALSPSFVFWSRQGIFVTNLTQPLCLFALWQGVRWLRTGANGAFILTGAGAGLALYAKLLAGWLLGPFAVLGLIGYVQIVRARRRDPVRGPHLTSRLTPHLTPGLLVAGLAAFLLALSPFIWFNMQTGGTLAQVGGNLTQSYYGVDNLAWRANLGVRLGQVIQTLRGDHFWYLGGLYANGLAPWLALAALPVGMWRPRLVGIPLLLLGSALALSIFTLSDLFITHFALLQPVLVGCVAVGWLAWMPVRRAGVENASAENASTEKARVGVRAYAVTVVLAAALWVGADGWATARYHGALASSGGLADHSDATYHFAYHLRYNGLGAPIALDWGMDAPVRFLTENTVRPIEIFGYASPDAPDDDFVARLALFLDNPDNVYLLRDASQTVFAGRREVFLEQVQARNGTPVLAATFDQRDGTRLFELWRVEFGEDFAAQ